jgi:hypothetical protein
MLQHKPNLAPPAIDLRSLKQIAGKAISPIAFQGLNDFLPLSHEEILSEMAIRLAKIAVNTAKYYKASEKTSYIGESNFELSLDQAFFDSQQQISIKDCASFVIRSEIGIFTASKDHKHLVNLAGCMNFEIGPINIRSGRNIFFLDDCHDLNVRDVAINNADGYGFILFNCTTFAFHQCLFETNLASGVMALGRTAWGEISKCTFRGSYGFLNQDAGVHLCATTPAVTKDMVPEHCHEAAAINQKAWRPHHIVVRDCLFKSCRAQGLYLEGTLNCIIERNIIIDNNKEGVCLDWGSCFNYFTNNYLAFNGQRRDMQPQEIEADFIRDYPLLGDGSSSMKLPGLSLDNGSANVISGNYIDENYGGGIKLVRAGFFNRIENNVITRNAVGSNGYVPHFHGIALLAVGSVNGEFNVDKASLLDFLPAMLNHVSNNDISKHFLAIYTDHAAIGNMIEFNHIDKPATDRPRYSAFYEKIIARIKRYYSQFS